MSKEALQKERLNEFLRISKEIENLERFRNNMADKIKEAMIESNVTEIGFSDKSDKDYTLKINIKKRHMIPNSANDKFIAELVGLGKGYLIKNTLTPNIPEIIEEIKSNDLPCDFVEKYIKTAEIVTLVCDSYVV